MILLVAGTLALLPLLITGAAQAMGVSRTTLAIAVCALEGLFIAPIFAATMSVTTVAVPTAMPPPRSPLLQS